MKHTKFTKNFKDKIRWILKIMKAIHTILLTFCNRLKKQVLNSTKKAVSRLSTTVIAFIIVFFGAIYDLYYSNVTIKETIWNFIWFEHIQRTLLILASTTAEKIKWIADLQSFSHAWNMFYMLITSTSIIWLLAIALITFFCTLRNTVASWIKTNLANDFNEDELKRTSLIEEIVKEIESQSSYSISVEGKWGEGKSFVLNKIISAISDKKTLTFKFNPWDIEKSVPIIKSFLIELGKNVRILKRHTKNLEKLLINIGKNRLGVFTSTRSIADEKNALIAELENKRLVIFIDDIDRLRPDQIPDLFQLVAEFDEYAPTKRIMFVLAFDRAIVERHLSNLNYPYTYIDKFLEASFQLVTSDQQLEEMFTKRLEEIKITDKETNEEISNDYVARVINSYRKMQRESPIAQFMSGEVRALSKKTPFFYSPRAVKKITKELKHLIKAKYAFTDPNDLFKIAIIKTFAPSLYKHISDNRELYMSNYFGKTDRNFTSDLNLRGKEIVSDMSKFQEYYGYHTIEILFELFPRIEALYTEASNPESNVTKQTPYDENTKEMAISNPEHFQMYFLDAVVYTKQTRTRFLSEAFSIMLSRTKFQKKTVELWRALSISMGEDINEKALIKRVVGANLAKGSKPHQILGVIEKFVLCWIEVTGKNYEYSDGIFIIDILENVNSFPQIKNLNSDHLSDMMVTLVNKTLSFKQAINLIHVYASKKPTIHQFDRVMNEFKKIYKLSELSKNIASMKASFTESMITHLYEILDYEKNSLNFEALIYLTTDTKLKNQLHYQLGSVVYPIRAKKTDLDSYLKGKRNITLNKTTSSNLLTTGHKIEVISPQGSNIYKGKIETIKKTTRNISIQLSNSL